MASNMSDDVPDKSCSSAGNLEDIMRWRQRIVKMEEKVIPPPRILLPTFKQIATHSTRGPATQRYLTMGSGETKTPENPYMIKELPKKNRERGYMAPTHRWRETVTLRDRLRVADEQEEKREKAKEVKRAQEVRKSREKFVRKQYVEELKQRTLNNILMGFIQDDIKMKQENTITVKVAIEQAQKEIERASKTMAEYLSEEQRNCENLTKKLNDILVVKKKREAQIESEKKKMSEVKLKIFRQSEYLDKMRKCREFVLQVAPEDWKKEYEKETIQRQFEVKDDIYKLKRAFGNYKTNCPGEDTGLEQVLEDFIIEFSTAGPPSLPYDDPKRVFGLFKDLELKSMRALHHTAVLKKSVERIKGLDDRCEKYLEMEKSTIDNMLTEIKEAIGREKRGLLEKKELLKNLKKGPFKKMIASEDTLKEHILVKDVYDEVIDQPKEGLDTLEMLQEIGELYFELNRKLEKLPLEEKKRLERKAKLTLDRAMMKAERAERRKKQVENMVKGLRRAREKPWSKTGRPLLFRSPPADVDQVRKKAVKEETVIGAGVLKEDVEANFPLVHACNHPGPGPYRRPSPQPNLLVDYKKFYPDLTIVDTDEDTALISESEEEKEGKKKADPAEEKKKVKRKKVKKIVDSDESI